MLKMLDSFLRKYCNLITWLGAVILSILFWYILYMGYLAIVGR